MTEASADSADAAWVARFKPLAKLAFERWLATGQWPTADEVQRNLDRANVEIDVIVAAEQMPRLLGEQRAVTPSSIELPLRVLAHLHPDADELLPTCVALVRRAIELYLSEVDELVLTSHDPELENDPEAVAPLLDRAASLVSTDFPNPFAGGASGQSTWNLNINVPQVRKYRGVRNPPDYLARQAEVLADMRPNRGVGQPPVLPSSVFVIMPFGTEWSAGVYDLIKRAAESLQPELDVLVYRADEISRPGR